MKYLVLIIAAFSVFSCQDAIRNKDRKVIVEEGTISTGSQFALADFNRMDEESRHPELIGYWVGYFEKDLSPGEEEQTYEPDVEEVWNRENKINISIDKIYGNTIIGHSVVAGNDRPFRGSIQKVEKVGDIPEHYTFDVKEPGDDKYDGRFVFKIIDDKLVGKWKAFKKINIQHRKYTLSKEVYSYNPEIKLVRKSTYADWYETNTKDLATDFDKTTGASYTINASNTLLKKEDVENLFLGDIQIIRNTIYARHGYSFKNRPLRIFFDAQDWYIPVHANIRGYFTEIEKKNIQLLLSYEKNATDYYDTFGR